MATPLPDEKVTTEKSLVERITHGIGWSAAIFGSICCFALLSIYRVVGDTTPMGEIVTVPPPIVWLAPLSLVFLPVLLARSWRAVLLCLCSAAVFLLVTQEWTSVLRTGEFEREKKGVRLITWNIADRSDWTAMLGELEKWQPDILYFQETPDGDASLSTETLTGYWTGFYWLDQGDCGILSRYPLLPLESQKIGPWDKPAVATATITNDRGTSTQVILCNVRLKMPAAVDIFDQRLRDAAVRKVTHEARVAQYKSLSAFVKLTQSQTRIAPALLGGDFNCRGGSLSLAAITTAGLRDVWPQSGCGWGATFLADFPVVRIDQLWASNEWIASQSRTYEGGVSDHRMVICDFRLK